MQADTGTRSSAAKFAFTRLEKEKNPELAGILARSAVQFASQQSDAQLLALLKRYGMDATVRTAVLKEFSHRFGRFGPTVGQSVQGPLGAVAPPPFTTVCELGQWCDANRPDLDFRTPVDVK